MSAIASRTRVELDLSLGCRERSCVALGRRLFEQLDRNKYREGVSLMPCPRSRQAWEAAHRTARKRAWRSERLGYRFAQIDRSRYSDDIYAINTSLPERQGRPMSSGYRRRVEHGRLPDYLCELHRILTYGVLEGERLVAYSTLYRVGELALVSMILGHGAHLRGDVMYLLAAGMIESHAGERCWFYYNRHDSGTDGLRFYKERVGFREADVDWRLA